MSESDSSEADDPRLYAAVQEYLHELESGQRVNRREFVSRYPEICGELSDCLDALAFVHSAAGEIHGTKSREAIRNEVDPSTQQPLGDFRLIRKIGHGGMGTVYEAIQLSLGRRVAVKVLSMAAALDERHLERFHNEAQAAARLHHTNIVPVYAVGCERSTHFYAMQLIEGHSLAEVIRELKNLAGQDLPKTTHGHSVQQADTTLTSLKAARSLGYYRSVVKLGLQAADALSYAHDAGIVHRDIKPANLLLDAQGKLWVTDFGLAQLNVDTGLTRSGDLVGTLRYMSPEQASGRAVVLDERTDIYSLGVTLYELLTLEKALPGTTQPQLLYQIAEQHPQPLRTLDKGIPRELETIVHKAMNKDAIDRYASTELMAADLRRFLQDEPILARPPTLLDKSIKWTRRHKGLTVSIIVLLGLAAIGFSVSTLMIAAEQRRTQIALSAQTEAAREAREQRNRAERSGRQARQAVDFFSRIATDEMDDPLYADIRREMLDESLAYFQSFLEDAGATAAISSELSSARARVTAFLNGYAALDAQLRLSAKLRLLSAPSVQKELGVNWQQVRPVVALASSSLASGRNRSTTQMATFESQITKEKMAALQAIGSSGVKRLDQIYFQTRGPQAFSDPDVIQQLDLSPAQQSKIRVIVTGFRGAQFGPPQERGRDGGPDDHHRGPDEGPRPAPPPRQDPPPREDPPPPRPPQDESMNWDAMESPRERQNRMRQEAMQSIVSLLTDSQAAEWKQLLGKPFDVRTIHVPPPDDRRGGPDPGGHPHPPNDE